MQAQKSHADLKEIYYLSMSAITFRFRFATSSLPEPAIDIDSDLFDEEIEEEEPDKETPPTEIIEVKATEVDSTKLEDKKDE